MAMERKLQAIMLVLVLVASVGALSVMLPSAGLFMASAANPGEPEVEKIMFIDRYKPTHSLGASDSDGDDPPCNTTSNSFKKISGGIKWDSTDFPVKYHINTANVGDINGDGNANTVQDKNLAGSEIDAAFGVWDSEEHPSGSFFQKVANSNEAKITVSWQPVDGVGGTLAFASISYSPPLKRILSVQIVFDSNDNWRAADTFVCGNVEGDLNILEFDLRNVAVHEIGHAVGLDHVNGGADVYNSLYTYILFELETHKSTLGDGDKTGIAMLYGDGGGDDGGDNGGGGPPCSRNPDHPRCT